MLYNVPPPKIVLPKAAALFTFAISLASLAFFVPRCVISNRVNPLYTLLGK